MSDLQHAANQRGIIAMVASQAAFVIGDCFVKLASAKLPTGQIMVVRGMFAVACVLGLIVAMGQARFLPRLLSPVILARACVEGIIIAAFLTALPLMPLGIIIAITQASPLILTLMSIVLFGEIVGWRRWCAIAVGFAGVLLVAKPGSAGLAMPAVLALLTAVFIAIRDILTRSVPRETPSLIVTFASILIAIGVGGVMALRESWVPMQWGDLAMLAGAAITVSTGNYFVIQAFRGTQVPVVSPFRYVVVIFGMILGFFIWNEVPDMASLSGAFLIVAAGVYMVHRERLRARAAALEALRGLAGTIPSGN